MKGTKKYGRRSRPVGASSVESNANQQDESPKEKLQTQIQDDQDEDVCRNSVYVWVHIGIQKFNPLDHLLTFLDVVVSGLSNMLKARILY